MCGPDGGGLGGPDVAPGPFGAIGRSAPSQSGSFGDQDFRSVAPGPFGAIGRTGTISPRADDLVGKPETVSNFMGTTPVSNLVSNTPGGQYPTGKGGMQVDWTGVGTKAGTGAAIGAGIGSQIGAPMAPQMVPGLIGGGLIGLGYGLATSRKPGPGATVTGEYVDDPGFNPFGYPGPNVYSGAPGADGGVSRSLPIIPPGPVFPNQDHPEPSPSPTPPPPAPPPNPPAPIFDPTMIEYFNRFSGQRISPEDFFNLITMSRKRGY